MAPIDLEKESIITLAHKMAAGDVSARSLTRHCLERIEKLDSQVNAIIEINPEAIKIADALDAERVGASVRGPLHGLPILVKDNLDTGDQMMTTAGSLALVGPAVKHDSFVVSQLRRAGAVLLGKTNLSEWANFRSTRSSSGWSSRGGQTRNAYAQDRSPGGSSSGSAVAVALSFCVAAIGTETDGSIVSPCAMNSIVGIKPTVGLVARSGIIPISHSQDTAGPMARSVSDAALILAAICGGDGKDEVTQIGRTHCVAIKSLVLDSGALKGARIGVARNYCGFHEGVDQLMAKAIDEIKSCGAQVIDDLELTPISDIRPAENILMATQFKEGLNSYLSKRRQPGNMLTLEDVIAFNRSHADKVMPWFQQELLQHAQATQGLESAEYLEAVETCRKLSQDEGIDRLVKHHALDAIIAPTTCTPWLIDWINGDNRTGGSACAAAVSGYPSITVPAGYVHGLPVGISFFSQAWCETKLLNLAYAYEQKSKNRIPPVLS